MTISRSGHFRIPASMERSVFVIAVADATTAQSSLVARGGQESPDLNPMRGYRRAQTYSRRIHAARAGHRAGNTRDRTDRCRQPVWFEPSPAEHQCQPSIREHSCRGIAESTRSNAGPDTERRFDAMPRRKRSLLSRNRDRSDAHEMARCASSATTSGSSRIDCRDFSDNNALSHCDRMA